MELLGFDHKTRRRRCKELLEQFDIVKLRKSLAQSLSGGERRRLEIARCLVSNPKIILLDEPFTGIDPVTIASIQKIIRRLRSEGIAILITDHQVRETLQITDRGYVIRAGKVDLSRHARRSAGQSRSPQVLLRRGHGHRPQSQRISAPGVTCGIESVCPRADWHRAASMQARTLPQYHARNSGRLLVKVN